MNYGKLCEFLSGKPKLEYHRLIVAGKDNLEGNEVEVKSFRVVGTTRTEVGDILADMINEYIAGKEHVLVRMMPEISKLDDPIADPFSVKMLGRARIVAY